MRDDLQNDRLNQTEKQNSSLTTNKRGYNL